MNKKLDSQKEDKWKKVEKDSRPKGRKSLTLKQI
jgi:hypothetical protein